MTLVLRSTHVRTVRRERVPIVLTPRKDVGSGVVADIARYQAIGSLQALALAVAGSLATPALLWLAL